MRLWGVIFGRPHFLRGRKGGTPPKFLNILFLNIYIGIVTMENFNIFNC